MKTFITQDVNWLHNRLIELGLYKTANGHDFLATCKGIHYGENEKYIFKHVDTYTFKEVRIFKKSKRVTVSRYKTNN